MTSVDWVTFRELATTLKPRSTNAFTIPAPIPCEAPVTTAVFLWLVMCPPGLVHKTCQESGLLDIRRGAADKEMEKMPTHRAPSARSRLKAALMSARCVKACGKLPRASPLEPVCSAYRPRWLA